jgi:hypothetical protein
MGGHLTDLKNIACSLVARSEGTFEAKIEKNMHDRKLRHLFIQ